jgi:hypothetical protein
MRSSLFFTADKVNATVILDTAEYNRKIIALLEDHAYRKLGKDPTECAEHKTVLLLKKSSFMRKSAINLCRRVPGPRGCMVFFIYFLLFLVG